MLGVRDNLGVLNVPLISLHVWLLPLFSLLLMAVVLHDEDRFSCHKWCMHALGTLSVARSQSGIRHWMDAF
jgi:hypothetical protein